MNHPQIKPIVRNGQAAFLVNGAAIVYTMEAALEALGEITGAKLATTASTRFMDCCGGAPRPFHPQFLRGTLDRFPWDAPASPDMPPLLSQLA